MIRSTSAAVTPPSGKVSAHATGSVVAARSSTTTETPGQRIIDILREQNRCSRAGQALASTFLLPGRARGGTKGPPCGGTKGPPCGGTKEPSCAGTKEPLI